MQVLENHDLIEFNTFGVPARAKFFTEIHNVTEALELFSSEVFKQNERLFLGGGSNVLFTKNFQGIVILNKLKGIEIISENEKEALVKSMSGEVWHDLVNFCVGHELWGIENLALIPGTVGATPVQNIGAYGAELANTLVKVEVIEIESGKQTTLTKDECELGYRDSIFKGKAKGKYFISAIVLRLNKTPEINISYKVLAKHLEDNKIEIKQPRDISEAVSAIRRSKLPDPKVVGNAGSFFKNVFVSKEKLAELIKNYPNISYFEEDGSIKIPAGWLIEQCGWKGRRVGNVGVHDKQALVLVNYGGATGMEIKDLAMQIIDSVSQKFGLTLSPEVNLI